ncbi:MAG: adenylyl-sulfate kinase, partial [Desulfobacteraceae bacterium]
GAVAFDLPDDIAPMGRFVIVDEYEISGGGIILEDLEDPQTWVRDKLYLRETKWEKSGISQEQRTEKYNQRATLILITGKKDIGKKPLARSLEARLFGDGRIVYFMNIGNVLYGVDADIKGRNNNRQEHLRRLSEVAHIMIEAGIILILTAIELTQEDIDLIKAIINPDKIEVIWIGDEVTTNVAYDLHFPDVADLGQSSHRVKRMLQEKGIIYKPL